MRLTGLGDIIISIILGRDKSTEPLQSSSERKLTCLFFQLLMSEKDEYFFCKLPISCQTEKTFYRLRIAVPANTNPITHAC